MPKIGRPLKGQTPKNISLQLRINEKTAYQLKQCANSLHISRTEVIEKGVEIVYNDALQMLLSFMRFYFSTDDFSVCAICVLFRKSSLVSMIPG